MIRVFRALIARFVPPPDPDVARAAEIRARLGDVWDTSDPDVLEYLRVMAAIHARQEGWD